MQQRLSFAAACNSTCIEQSQMIDRLRETQTLHIPAAGMDALRMEVTQSTWAVDFRADVRSSMVVRAVEVLTVLLSVTITARPTQQSC